ncbi:MAG: pyruvate kinase alpha/beta domain-containing protein [Candidatus Njordarchaeales archaeon]
MIKREVVYFENPGKENTEKTLELAKKRADELGIKDIVVASTTGYTASKAVEIFNPKGYNLVIVTHMTGFKEPGTQEFPSDLREKLVAEGAKILTCSHAFGGIERAIRKILNTWGPVELMAQTLRLFGEGLKVAVEIVVMAADAGLIPVNRDVIAIAGTGRGADTACIIKPAHTSNFFDLFVKEIICKPLKHF